MRIRGLKNFKGIRSPYNPSGLPPVSVVVQFNGTTIPEDITQGTLVGTLSVADPGNYSSVTFSLLNTASGRFQITNNNEVRIAAGAVFDFETETSVVIRAQAATNLGNGASNFTIGVTDVNEEPTDISLSNASIPEDTTPGSTVGTLSGVDPDGDDITFSLVANPGGKFAIDGDLLKVAPGATFDYETQSSITIRVRAYDGGLFYEKAFTINVTDVDDEDFGPVTISVTDGGGYTGSTYTASDNRSLSKQWYADGVAISGANSNTYVMTAENEGKSITYTRGGYTSNAIHRWVYSDLGSTLVAWFDAYDASTVTHASGVVSNWANKAGNFDAVAIDSNSSPLYSSTGLGGAYPAITADGINDRLVISSPLAQDDQFAMVMLKTTESEANANWYNSPAIWGSEQGGVVSDFGWGLYDGYPQYGATAAGTGSIGTTRVNNNTKQLFGFDRTSTSGGIRHWVNGSANGTATLASGTRTASADSALFTMGPTVGTSAGKLAGSMGELVICNTVLSDVDRAYVEGAMAWKWGTQTALPTNHLFRNSPPNYNQTPSNITLSNNSVPENSSNGTSVGTLSTTDADAGDTFTYTLTNSAGGLFSIVGNTLQVAGSLNFESATSHSITVRTTDSGGRFFEKAFTINITNVNETPTDIALSSNFVLENASIGASIGTFSTTDPDAANTFTYTLTDSAGGLFGISGNSLVVASELDYETATSHSITVRSTDQCGLFYEKEFTIDVIDVNDSIPYIFLTSGSGYVGSTFTTTITGGQWYADETAISGQTGSTYTMSTIANEGKAITYRVGNEISNVLKFWTPASISGYIVGWWDAMDTSRINSGSVTNNANVTVVNSKVGSLNLTASSAFPVYRDAANGHRTGYPSFYNSGSNCFTFSNLAALPNLTESMTVMAVGYATKTTGLGCLAGWSNSGTAGQNVYFGHSSTVTASATRGTGFDAITTESWANTDLIYSGTIGALNRKVWANGQTNVTATNGFTNMGTITNAWIFQGAPSGNFFQGYLNEIVILNTDLSNEDRQKYEGYLAARWDLRSKLPADHPYKSVAPVDAYATITTDGGYVGSTYTSAFSGGQWYADETAIPGATGTTYTMTFANEGKAISYRSATRRSNTIKPWTPMELSANIVGWWDAYDTANISLSGSNVTQVNSRVGTRPLTATANWPTYSATGRNGRPAFTAATTSIKFEIANPGTLPSGTSTSTTAMVGYLDSAKGGWSGLVSWGSGENTQGYSRLFGQGSLSGDRVALSDNGTNLSQIPVVWSGFDRIFVGEMNNTIHRLWTDSGYFGSVTDTHNQPTPNYAKVFGDTQSVAGTTNAWQGSFQEIVIFDAALNAEDRMKLEGYFAARWGLRAQLKGNPYKTAVPQAKYVDVGDGSTVVSLTSGTGYAGSTYTVNTNGGQWYADGIPIYDETDSTYVMTSENEGKTLTYRVSGALVSNGVRYWAPKNMRGLIAWFDAYASSSMIVSGGFVRNWNSRVGSYYLSQTGADSLKPTYSATGRNNLPAVSGDGSARYMSLNEINFIPTTTVPSTVAGHAYSAKTGSWSALYSWGSTATSAARGLNMSNTNFVAFGGNTNNIISSVLWNTDRIGIVGVTGTTATSSLFVDGSSGGTSTTAFSAGTTSAGQLFRSTSNADYWNGPVQDLLVFNVVLTTTERQMLEGYLASKWGTRANLPSGHPYKSVNPT